MAAFPPLTIDGIASALSLVLAAVASLRAGSRLCRRIDMGGTIGLMDGPPILGPPPPTAIHHQTLSRGRHRRRSPRSRSMLDESGGMMIGRVDDDDDDDDDDGRGGAGGGVEDREMTEQVEASPLWEHAEAFRRAAILGLLFDDDIDDGSSSPSDVVMLLYSDVVRHDGGRSISGVGRVVGGGVGEEDPVIAAAVEAGLGLLMPGGGARGGGGGRGSAVQNRSMGRGLVGWAWSGGGAVGLVDNDNDGDDGDGIGFGNPIVLVASWFARELSAPFAALPAWHGLLRSYLRERREGELRKSRWCALLTPWKRSLALIGLGCGEGGKARYDPSGLDFDESISATARIPWFMSLSADASSVDVDDDDDGGSAPISSHARSVRVRAFAPRTFRDLRNRCFRVKEWEYAESILNAPSLNIFDRNGGGLSCHDGCDDHLASCEDMSISHIIRGILAEEQQEERYGTALTSLPYISFQSNSKGAARAGTYFFFSADGAYMIKTVKNEEARAFLNMLPEYHRFMSNRVNGRNSLLTRIFGMYSVQFPPDDPDDDRIAQDLGDRWDGGLFSSSGHERGGGDLTDDERVYLVMHSVFPPEASSFVTERFDLKGSSVGRECSAEERRLRGANAVLKDLDLKREVEEELRKLDELDVTVGGSGHDRNKTSRYGICIGKRSKKALMAQLERDVDLLCRCNVLDYSLLVGVADMDDLGITNDVVKGIASGGRVPMCIRNFFRWLDFPMPYYGAGTTKVDGGVLSSLRGTRKGMKVMYYLGVIDFLQPWTVKKRLERDLKGLAGFDKSEISCVHPADFAARFLKFVNSHVT